MDTLPLGLFLEIPRPRQIKKQSRIVDTFRSIPCQILRDDFYTSLIDWVGNTVFFSENNAIIAHNFNSTSQMFVYKHFKESSICSIRSMKQTNSVVVGDSHGNLTFIDLNTLKSEIRPCHDKRISALHIMGDKVLTGSGDRKCKVIDSRAKAPQKTFQNHALEVCGVSVNREEKLICTGGNDNRIAVIDIRNETCPLFKFDDHKAAVRALSWSPLHSTKFVSGGGTADKTIKSWDISLKDPLVKSINFESQICNLKWLHSNKVISSFGYSDDDIRLLNNFEVENRYIGHKNRVIHFSVNDTEDFFASGSADFDIKVYEIDKKVYEDIKIR